MTEEKESKYLLTLNERRNVYLEKGKEFDFTKQSNIPFFDVEDRKNWKGYATKDGNPNLIGQIHETNQGVVFHLCYKPGNRMLTKDELKAIIKGIEYIEEFAKKKHN